MMTKQKKSIWYHQDKFVVSIKVLHSTRNAQRRIIEIISKEKSEEVTREYMNVLTRLNETARKIMRRLALR